MNLNLDKSQLLSWCHGHTEFIVMQILLIKILENVFVMYSVMVYILSHDKFLLLSWLLRL